jgi:AraC family transcriptional regulator
VPATGAAPSARDAKRISAVLRHIEHQADAPIDLDALAALACMSKYHFLRTFRRLVGTTPYRFTLDLRLRRAAVALRTTREPVGAIAFGAGFGDLSTFNHRFRAVFGAAPIAFRNA